MLSRNVCDSCRTPLGHRPIMENFIISSWLCLDKTVLHIDDNPPAICPKKFEHAVYEASPKIDQIKSGGGD